MLKFSTYEGGTVRVRRVGPRFEFELMSAKGEVEAFVDMSSDDAWQLLANLGEELDS
ncbi:hypothetical protein [Streptomyces tsukubensis]|uniref:hypothetical protein n=1 Tax=Streptomyces tsukubensis TaxID=83656 RepID=UPI00344E741A